MQELSARHLLRAILAADAVGYSRLMAEDDHSTLDSLDAAREIFRSLITAHGGRVVDMAGDSVLAVFDAAASAVQTALDAQARLSALANAATAERRMDFRIGVHLGDVIEKDDGSVYGDGINVAARLQSLARPGGIVVSQSIHGAVAFRIRVHFVDIGEHSVKNIAQPVHAFECGTSAPWEGGSPAIAPSSPAVASRSRTRLVAVGFAIACSLALAGWFAVQRDTVQPYSEADQRMTFAVLPVPALNGDATSERVAQAAVEALQTGEEARFLWARVSPRQVVDKAHSAQPGMRQLGSALGVHFLLRGTVSHVAAGYSVEVAVIDVQTERVLDARSLQAVPTRVPVLDPARIEDALSSLTFKGLEVEVARARGKRDSSLDVRDLAFRAFVDWNSGKPDAASAYAKANSGLDRALALAPDDLLALQLKAQVNVCDCLRSWAKDVDVKEKAGLAALDKYLSLRPNNPGMRTLRSRIFFRHRRYEEALLIADDVLRREPQWEGALSVRTRALLMLDRIPEAVAASQALVDTADEAYSNGLAALVRYRARDDSAAIRLAKVAMSRMTQRELADPDNASVALILIAAEARSGHPDRARAALKNFQADAPEAGTIAQIKAWLPASELEIDGETLFDGLRLAGVSE